MASQQMPPGAAEAYSKSPKHVREFSTSMRRKHNKKQGKGFG
jgi:hypothetical protein